METPLKFYCINYVHLWHNYVDETIIDGDLNPLELLHPIKLASDWILQNGSVESRLIIARRCLPCGLRNNVPGDEICVIGARSAEIDHIQPIEEAVQCQKLPLVRDFREYKNEFNPLIENKGVLIY